ncbi:MAG: 2-C-methyl-D-erythritol 4-phosphate cytidylyltransferase [Tannerellaceae bacterium]|jgi:2-C-methyl-D-erythritol 4-phosphate cytidylyltransferase|nr:2-C-methyl-D-erythritol 4-phosphate cytidylyltransferase [Tannerellaceae bacterium]
MRNHVIIVGGGKGTRIGNPIPKQFLPLGGKPILMRTIECFYVWNQKVEIILPLPEEYLNYWQELCSKYHFTVPCRICVGGETRFHSVKNGLEQVEEPGFVAVHDAVRPFASVALIEACFAQAWDKDSAIPVIALKDSIREIVGCTGTSRTADRSKYAVVQTPQVFHSGILRAAYGQSYNPLFTDDASVVEIYGAKIHLVEGEETNIKITTPLDLRIAEAILHNRCP